MCFRIDRNADRPKRKYVYKVVQLRNHELRSVVQVSHTWYPGTFEIRKNAITSRGVFDRANEGFYVYLNKADAENHANWGNYCHLVVLRLIVDPADWLHSEKTYAYDNPRVATYRRVTVPENQPDVEFYA